MSDSPNHNFLSPNHNSLTPKHKSLSPNHNSLKQPSNDNPPKTPTNDNPPKTPTNDNPPKKPTKDNPPKTPTNDNPPKTPTNDNPPKKTRKKIKLKIIKKPIQKNQNYNSLKKKKKKIKIINKPIEKKQDIIILDNEFNHNNIKQLYQQIIFHFRSNDNYYLKLKNIQYENISIKKRYCYHNNIKNNTQIMLLKYKINGYMYKEKIKSKQCNNFNNETILILNFDEKKEKYSKYLKYGQNITKHKDNPDWYGICRTMKEGVVKSAYLNDNLYETNWMEDLVKLSLLNFETASISGINKVITYFGNYNTPILLTTGTIGLSHLYYINEGNITWYIIHDYENFKNIIDPILYEYKKDNTEYFCLNDILHSNLFPNEEFLEIYKINYNIEEQQEGELMVFNSNCYYYGHCNEFTIYTSITILPAIKRNINFHFMENTKSAIINDYQECKFETYNYNWKELQKYVKKIQYNKIDINVYNCILEKKKCVLEKIKIKSNYEFYYKKEKYVGIINNIFPLKYDKNEGYILGFNVEIKGHNLIFNEFDFIEYQFKLYCDL